MASDNKKIEELFTDTGPFNEEMAIEVVKHFGLVHRESKEIFLTPQAQNLKAEEKVLVVGLLKKLLKRGGKTESENLSRSDLVKLGIKEGTIDGTLNRLRNKGDIIPIGRGEHEIPNTKVDEIIERLREKLQGNEQSNS